MNRAVFLDRDNTLIANDGYLADAEQVRLMPGAAEAVSRFRKAGYYVIVVTNQSGVARGLMTEEQLATVNQRMQDLLRAQGTGVDALYYCPFLPGPEAVVEAYRRDSELRKPRPGMLLLAAKEMNLDLAASWLVGDAERDVEAGKAGGCRTIRLALPAGESTAADHTAADLPGAAELLLSQAARPAASEKITAPSAGAVAAAAPLGGSAAASPSTPPAPSPIAPARPSAAETPSQSPAAPNDAASGAPTMEQLLTQILDELRTARRTAAHRDFSAATLAGAVAQAFAIFALGWALFAAVESASNQAAYNDAILRLLAASVFQLLALTWFNVGRK